MLVEASRGELALPTLIVALFLLAPLTLHSGTFQLHATHTPLTQLASPLQRIVSGEGYFFLA